MNIKNNCRGDTIVEVLISLAILTSILVGAYVTANRAQNSNQASQERIEATKIAESEIEKLKFLTTATLPAGSSCINSAIDDYVEITSGEPSNSLDTDSLNYTSPCGNINGIYNVAIQTDTPNTYRILVRWERINGGRDQLEFYYRTY